MVTITLSAAGAKKAASRLREFLAADGISLKQTHAYEALAQTFGYANWNTLQALLNAAASPESTASPASDEKLTAEQRPERKTALSQNLQQSLHGAIRLASERHHEYATPEHLLLSLTEDQNAVSVLRACGVDLERLRKELTEFIDTKLDRLVTTAPGNPKPNASFQRVVQHAIVSVLGSGRETVTGADVLLALLSPERESPAVDFLQQQDMSYQDAMTYISEGIAKRPGPDPS
jgi:hypothetical protein